MVGASTPVAGAGAWPELPYEAWKDTLDTLHMNVEIVGKVRLALTPREPQWANAALHLTARGLTTGPMQQDGVIFEIDLDLVDHWVVIRTTRGEVRRVALTARPVADFYADFMSTLGVIGIKPQIRPIPDEVADPIPFADDTTHSAYEPEWANRFFTVLSRIDLVFKEYRSRFRGRTSAVHFFWGSFDLANTRFSGREATPPAGAGIIERLSADAEEVCAGFWAGEERYPRPALYSYAYPKPEGFEHAVIEPREAAWTPALGLFALPYEEVQKSSSPREAMLEFLESTYAAAARLSSWDPALISNRPDRRTDAGPRAKGRSSTTR